MSTRTRGERVPGLQGQRCRSARAAAAAAAAAGAACLGCEGSAAGVPVLLPLPLLGRPAVWLRAVGLHGNRLRGPNARPFVAGQPPWAEPGRLVCAAPCTAWLCLASQRQSLLACVFLQRPPRLRAEPRRGGLGGRVQPGPARQVGGAGELQPPDRGAGAQGEWLRALACLG